MRKSILSPINKAPTKSTHGYKKFMIAYSSVWLTLLALVFVGTACYKDQAFAKDAHKSLSKIVGVYSKCTSRPKAQIWTRLENKLQKSRWDFTTENCHQSISYIISEDDFVNCFS